MKKERIKEFLLYAAVPIFLLALFLLSIPAAALLGFPTDEKVFLELVENYYARYGYWVVFVAALIEGVLFVNWYFPGSIVAVLGVVFAPKVGLSVVVVVILIILAFLVAAVLNYFLGKYGWYRLFLKFGLKTPLDRIKKRTEKFGLQIIFSTYFHPNMGALVATSAGILHIPFLKFFLYSALALAVWDTFWGVLVYLLGPIILKFLSIQLIVAIMAIWIAVLAIKYFRHKQQPPASVP